MIYWRFFLVVFYIFLIAFVSYHFTIAINKKDDEIKAPIEKKEIQQETRIKLILNRDL